MIKDMILKCRCYRRFDSLYEIDEDILRSIVYSLRYISSAKNAQPLKYIVPKNEQKNKEIFSTLRWAGI